MNYFYLIYYCLDLPKSIGITLVRGGLFITAFACLEYLEEWIFGESSSVAFSKAIDFFWSALFPLLGLFFLMIFVSRLASKVTFLKKHKEVSKDPYLMHKLWEKHIK